MISRKRKRLVEFELRTTCRGGGMADAADLKSVVRKDVRVRLPPSAPLSTFATTTTDVRAKDLKRRKGARLEVKNLVNILGPLEQFFFAGAEALGIHHSSLVPQRHQRIDSRRTARGDVTRQQRDQQ